MKKAPKEVANIIDLFANTLYDCQSIMEYRQVPLAFNFSVHNLKTGRRKAFKKDSIIPLVRYYCYSSTIRFIDEEQQILAQFYLNSVKVK